MRKRPWMAVVGAALLLILSACSARTMALLEEERKNGAHFASWGHMGYSLRRGTAETTTQGDVEAAQKDKWWGEVVMVQPIQ